MTPPISVCAPARPAHPSPGLVLALVAVMFATAAILVTSRCFGQPPGEPSAHGLESPVPLGDPVTPEERPIVDRMLTSTRPIRKNDLHPEWEAWTSDDILVIRLDQDAGIMAGRQQICLHYQARAGLDNGWIRADLEDGTIRSYSNNGVVSAIEVEMEAGRLPSPELTPQEAIEEAKAYVKAMMGEFPEDLVVTYLASPRRFENPEQMPANPSADLALWSVTFMRYAGRMPYAWHDDCQGLEIVFSERHGVWQYVNRYLDAWDGKVSVNPEKALAIAEQGLEVHQEWIERALKRPGSNVGFMLRLPPYIKEGRPIIGYVEENDGFAPHAIWVAVAPYAREPDEEFTEESAWHELEFYVDAETGKLLKLTDTGNHCSWGPEEETSDDTEGSDRFGDDDPAFGVSIESEN